MKPTTFYSNGKLLITGEYLVLDGAQALAIPTKFGQSLTVEPFTDGQLKWESFDASGNIWFETTLSLEELFNNSKETLNPFAKRLLQILHAAKSHNPKFLNDNSGLNVKTQLDFPRNWGLGTSSTLINNMAQWAKIDAYALLEDTFGGSGYDIACAKHNTPITYQLQKKERTIIETNFNPEFRAQLYFVFLNKKQNSRDGITAYKNNRSNIYSALSEINAITKDIISCTTLETFQFLMQNHENIISNIIKQKPIKETLFKDFNGSIKSLGAWGGDFVLVASEDDPTSYFKNKGFNTIIPYQDMIL